MRSRWFQRWFAAPAEVLDPQPAYELWAETYDDPGNALLYAEHQAVYPLLETVKISGNWALDAGCGTGRYTGILQTFNPGMIAAVDFAPRMIQAAKAKFSDPSLSLLIADIGSLPFADQSFDFVLSSLALDYLPSLRDGVRELSRMLRRQASMIVSVGHPNGERLGWQRTFRSGNGRNQLCAVKFYAHECSEYVSEFQAANLNVEQIVEPLIGESLKPFYEKAGRLDLYDRFQGHPLLLVFRLTKR
jgi:malonyl-CoA O-methyltransferase